MVENRPGLTIISHLFILLGILAVCFPIYLAFVASTQTASEVIQVPLSLIPGTQLLENYSQAFMGAGGEKGASVANMLWISLVMTLIIAIGKIAISLLSAFAIVYFRFPCRMLLFWLIFITLMLPVEVRIIPTFDVVANLHMLNSFAG